jgi:hypothetical protein
LLLPLLAGLPAQRLWANPAASNLQQRSELRAALHAQRVASQPAGSESNSGQAASARRLSLQERAELREQLRQTRSGMHANSLRP